MEKEGGKVFSGIWNSKGQVTIFIIIAVLVVAAAVGIYFLRSSAPASTNAGLDVNNPNGYIQNCLQDSMQQIINNISLQGGDLVPTNYYAYNGSEIEYLCYTNQYYKTCSIQQPLLQEHIESQIQTAISGDVSNCFNSLQQSYQNQGYTANMVPGNITVQILPGKIVTSFSHKLTITKTNTQTYDKFSIVLNNNLYELVNIANSIVDWEAQYGDADATTYMDYYKGLNVGKRQQLDGTTIYILTDTNTGTTFQFASRSVAYPPGI